MMTRKTMILRVLLIKLVSKGLMNREIDPYSLREKIQKSTITQTSITVYTYIYIYIHTYHVYVCVYTMYYYDKRNDTKGTTTQSINIIIVI